MQCAIPVFDCLFESEEWDELVHELLFSLTTWHALAKLRLHTDISLADLEESGKGMCNTIRKWMRQMCKKVKTQELKKETEARGRRTAALAAQGQGGAGTSGKLEKNFNFNTPKVHRIMDYPNAIRQFGPTDGFSTWRVSAFLFTVQRFLMRSAV
jgi:hypothetical protein